MIPKTQYGKIRSYTTKDGSFIRELYHPAVHGNKQQSLAEATIPINSETISHKHTKTEEIYHITQGVGLMTLGKDKFGVSVGDTVCILPGTPHSVKNTGGIPLKILCCCSPAYSHDDTELI